MKALIIQASKLTAIVPDIKLAKRKIPIATPLNLLSMQVWIIDTAGGLHPSQKRYSKKREVIETLNYECTTKARVQIGRAMID